MALAHKRLRCVLAFSSISVCLLPYAKAAWKMTFLCNLFLNQVTKNTFEAVFQSVQHKLQIHFSVALVM